MESCAGQYAITTKSVDNGLQVGSVKLPAPLNIPPPFIDNSLNIFLILTGASINPTRVINGV
jgi:hypothetical protein